MSKVCLLWDNCSAHAVCSVSDVDIIFLPPNCTALLQPLDQGVLATVKSIYREEVLKCLLKHLDTIVARQDAGRTMVEGTAGLEFGLHAHIGDVCRIVHRVWSDIKQQTIINCFLKARILPESVSGPLASLSQRYGTDDGRVVMSIDQLCSDTAHRLELKQESVNADVADWLRIDSDPSLLREAIDETLAAVSGDCAGDFDADEGLVSDASGADPDPTSQDHSDSQELASNSRISNVTSVTSPVLPLLTRIDAPFPRSRMLPSTPAVVTIQRLRVLPTVPHVTSPSTLPMPVMAGDERARFRFAPRGVARDQNCWMDNVDEIRAKLAFLKDLFDRNILRECDYKCYCDRVFEECGFLQAK